MASSPSPWLLQICLLVRSLVLLHWNLCKTTRFTFSSHFNFLYFWLLISYNNLSHLTQIHVPAIYGDFHALYCFLPVTLNIHPVIPTYLLINMSISKVNTFCFFPSAISASLHIWLNCYASFSSKGVLGSPSFLVSLCSKLPVRNSLIGWTYNYRTNDHVAKEKEEDWACQLCTLINEPAAKACDACLSPRPEGEWLNSLLHSLKSMNRHYVHDRMLKQWYITCALSLWNAANTNIFQKKYTSLIMCWHFRGKKIQKLNRDHFVFREHCQSIFFSPLIAWFAFLVIHLSSFAVDRWACPLKQRGVKCLAQGSNTHGSFGRAKT